MFGHRPRLPRSLLNLIVNARVIAQTNGASVIEPSHILAVIDGATTVHDDNPRDLPLSSNAKRAIQEAIKSAGRRDAMAVSHLKEALLSLS